MSRYTNRPSITNPREDCQKITRVRAELLPGSWVRVETPTDDPLNGKTRLVTGLHCAMQKREGRWVAVWRCTLAPEGRSVLCEWLTRVPDPAVMRRAA